MVNRCNGYLHVSCKDTFIIATFFRMSTPFFNF
nr:MAG TPA: hypothetical protein [Caudoviricetes sp.]